MSGAAVTPESASELALLVVSLEVPSPYGGRCSQRLFGIIELMLAAGHRVTVVAGSGFGEAAGVRMLFRLGVTEVVPFGAERIGGGLEAGQITQDAVPRVALPRLLEQGRFDAVWLNGTDIASRCVPLIRRRSPGTRILLDSTGPLPPDHPRDIGCLEPATRDAATDHVRDQTCDGLLEVDVNVTDTDAHAEQLRALAPGLAVHTIEARSERTDNEPLSRDDLAAIALQKLFTSAIPVRWQIDAASSRLPTLLSEFAREYRQGDPALLVLTVPQGDQAAPQQAIDRVTNEVNALGLDLGTMADVEILPCTSAMPTPRRTLLWGDAGRVDISSHNGRVRSFNANNGEPAPKLAFGAVATSNYLPWVRVFAASVREQHPEAPCIAMLLDEPDPGALRDDDNFEIATPSDLPMSESERAWLFTIYDAKELCGALRPWLLELLLGRAASAFCIDPDTLLLAPLDDIAELAIETGLALTPHSLEPLPQDGKLPSDDTLLQDGQFNSGFVAVGRSNHGFVEFWKEKLLRECFEHQTSAPFRFWDQRWLDLAVGYFPLAIIRDAGVNFGFWRLGPRQIERREGRYVVDDVPLRLMHFAGFNPSHPETLSRYPGDLVRAASTAPAVLELTAMYAARLRDAGWEPPSHGDPIKAGMILTDVVRRALRTALVTAEQSDPPPEGVALDAISLLDWLAGRREGGHNLPRYLQALRKSDPRVAATFSDIPGDDELRLRRWLASDPRSRAFVPDVLVDTGAAATSAGQTSS